MKRKPKKRGFAAMDKNLQSGIARLGGLEVSRNRRHMADIGRLGGLNSHGGVGKRRAKRQLVYR